MSEEDKDRKDTKKQIIFQKKSVIVQNSPN